MKQLRRSLVTQHTQQGWRQMQQGDRGRVGAQLSRGEGGSWQRQKKNEKRQKERGNRSGDQHPEAGKKELELGFKPSGKSTHTLGPLATPNPTPSG